MTRAAALADAPNAAEIDMVSTRGHLVIKARNEGFVADHIVREGG
jgi:hypothetical protein